VGVKRLVRFAMICRRPVRCAPFGGRGLTRKVRMESVNKGRALGRDTRGLSTVEYVLLLVLIAAGSISAWEKFGDKVVSKVDSSTDAIGKMKP
jgi:Flp pilus assembly pilin Flp